MHRLPIYLQAKMQKVHVYTHQKHCQLEIVPPRPQTQEYQCGEETVSQRVSKRREDSQPISLEERMRGQHLVRGLARSPQEQEAKCR